MPKRLIIATGNEGKSREFRALLGETIEVQTLADFPELVMPPETGLSFKANAAAKARFVMEKLGLPTLADDSGLVVDALNGAPGVRSARYAPGSDKDRYVALLAALRGVPSNQRSARFVCAMAFFAPGQDPAEAEGRCEGQITTEASGEEGFGYDPIFRPEGRDLTMAALSMEEKSAISHRGNAVKKILVSLQSYFSLELGLRKP
jgi:XTP/dITP diphosphohydrolase